MLNEDYRDMLHVLSDEKVKFLLVGAYALAAHGYPRTTMDIDIWVMPSAQNAHAVQENLMNPEKGKDLPTSVVNALSQGRKIEAIKLLREEYGIGLKEAKDMVDEYVKSQPELSMKLADFQQESKRRFFRWIVILAVISLALYWWFIRK